MNQCIFVGIDLGTTNTTCTILRQSQSGIVSIEKLSIYQAAVVKNHDTIYTSNTLLPSKVFFPKYEKKIYCGECKSEMEGTEVREIKMKMGDDLWRVDFGSKSLTPTDVSGIILKTVYSSLVKAVEGIENVKGIAITIPASFSSKMRRATLEAAVLAGFDVTQVHLVDEPVAAIFSQCEMTVPLKFDVPNNESFMVYDIGGGTIDVTIMRVKQSEKTVEIIATSRFNDIGGRTFDIEIAALIIEKLESDRNLPIEIKSLLLGVDQKSKSLILSLTEASEKIKIAIFDKNIKSDFKYSNFKDLINLVGFRIPESIRLSEYWKPLGLTLSIEISTFDIISRLEKFFTNSPDNKGWDVLNPIKQALSNYKQGVAPEKCYLVGGSRYFKPIKFHLETMYDVRNNLHAFYSVSEGAAKYLYLKSEAKWKIFERTTEKVFLKRSGAPYIQILDSNIRIPSKNIVFSDFNSERSVNFDEGTNSVSIELYQGDSGDDPFMHNLCSRKTEFEIPFINDAYLKSVISHVDENKNYDFDIVIQEDGEPLAYKFRIMADEKRSFQNNSNTHNRIARIRINE